MFFEKKGHSWFWYAFWTLAAAALIYLVARFFQSSTNKLDAVRPSPKRDKPKSPDYSALFI